MNARIAAFLVKARLIDNRDDAQALSDEELDVIYVTETAPTGPKNVIKKYRDALKAAGLSLYFVEMPMSMYREGDKVTQEPKVRGTFREREGPMQERKAREAGQYNAILEYAHDVSLLEGKVDAYLERAFALCHSSHMEECAVGLLMATGRRNEEIGHTARMTPLDQPYWVAYSGQLKAGEAGLRDVKELAVLVPNDLVCHRLAQVQTQVALELALEGMVFDNRIGRSLRRAVHDTLDSLFPDAKSLSPRVLRNFHLAIALEAVTPDGTPLCTGDVDHFIGRMLGHQSNDFRARDHYKRQLLPRMRHNYVLPS